VPTGVIATVANLQVSGGADPAVTVSGGQLFADRVAFTSNGAQGALVVTAGKVNGVDVLAQNLSGSGPAVAVSGGSVFAESGWDVMATDAVVSIDLSGTGAAYFSNAEVTGRVEVVDAASFSLDGA